MISLTNNIGRNGHRFFLHGKKTACPACKRLTFTDYIDSATNLPVAHGICGRCDRENNCAYHMPPRRWFAENRPLTPSQPMPPKSFRTAPTPVRRMHMKHMLMSLSHYDSNPLARYLHSCFDEILGADEVDRQLARYFLGTSKLWGGAAVFWQVDALSEVRGGKIVGYGPDGHRLHGKNSWAHSVLKGDYPNFGLEQCLFGAHLLPGATAYWQKVRELLLASGAGAELSYDPLLFLLESEKGAIITSLALRITGDFRDCVCLATGGSELFNPKPQDLTDPAGKYRALKGREVCLLPDQGQFEKWRERARVLSGFCSAVYVVPVMEKSLFWDESVTTDQSGRHLSLMCPIEKGDGFDDILLRYLQGGHNLRNAVDTLLLGMKKWRV